MHETYLTYAEYQSYGGTLTATEFPVYEFKARKRIDYLTASRVQNMAAVPTSVKLAMMELIALEHDSGAAAQAAPTVSSFNTDGYSESYGGSKLSIEQTEKAMNDSIRHSLYGEVDDEGTPLLYRGVTPYR